MPLEGRGSSPPAVRTRSASDAVESTGQAPSSSSQRDTVSVLEATNEQVAKLQDQVARLEASLFRASSTANFLVTSLQSVSQQYMHMQQNISMSAAAAAPAAAPSMEAPKSPPKGKGKGKAQQVHVQDPLDASFDIFDARRASWDDTWGPKCPTPSCTNPGPGNGNWCSRCRRVWSSMPQESRKGT